MKIPAYFESGRPIFSFEFFPPKTEEGVEHLFRTIGELKALAPAFVSVTYGAGGSNRQRTVEVVKRIKGEHGVEAMAHLTCVGSDRDEIDRVLGQLKEAGIENVLALQGDPPKGRRPLPGPPTGSPTPTNWSPISANVITSRLEALVIRRARRVPRPRQRPRPPKDQGRYRA